LTEGGKVDVWDLSAGRHLYTARNPEKAVTCVKVSIILEYFIHKTILQVHNGSIFCTDKSIQKLKMQPNSSTSLLLNTAHMIPHKYFSTIRCICIHGNNIYYGDDGVDLKVFNSITGEFVLYIQALRHVHAGQLMKYRTHPGKNVFTGAVDIVDDVIMCAGYDVDQGMAYINSKVFVCVCAHAHTQYSVYFTSYKYKHRYLQYHCSYLLVKTDYIVVWYFIF